MFTKEQISIIEKSLDKGNNVMIRQIGGDIQVMEQKMKTIFKTHRAPSEKNGEQGRT